MQTSSEVGPRGRRRHQGRREGRKMFPEGNLVKLRDFRLCSQIYVFKVVKDHNRRH